MPRHIATSIPCDHTSTVDWLKLRAVDKLKKVFGISVVDFSTAQLYILTRSGNIQDSLKDCMSENRFALLDNGSQLVAELGVVKAARERKEQPIFKLICPLSSSSSAISGGHRQSFHSNSGGSTGGHNGLRHSASSVDFQSISSTSTSNDRRKKTFHEFSVASGNSNGQNAGFGGASRRTNSIVSFSGVGGGAFSMESVDETSALTQGNVIKKGSGARKTSIETLSPILPGVESIFISDPNSMENPVSFPDYNANDVTEFIPNPWLSSVKHCKSRKYKINFVFLEERRSISLADVDGDYTIHEMKAELWRQIYLTETGDDMGKYVLQYVNSTGQMIDLYDESQFVHTISIINYWTLNCMDFTFYVTLKQLTISKRAQAVNKKIMDLIGYSGIFLFDCVSDYEVDIFKRKMVSLRRSMLQTRNEFHYNFPCDIDFAPLTKSLIDLIGSTGKIQVRIHLPNGQIVKTTSCNYDDSADEIISAFIPKNTASLPANTTVDDYFLKACGRDEYFYGKTPIINYSFIRSCLLKEERINISLLLIRDTCRVFTKSDSLEEHNPIEDPCVNIGTHSELTIQGRTEAKVSAISLWDVSRNFRIQITACENLKSDAVDTLYVEAGIYHGGELMCPILKTHQVSMSSNPRWGVWLNFDIPCYNLPRTARLCITLWSRTASKKKLSLDRDFELRPVGWVNVPIMDFKGYMKAGLTRVSLWPDEKANPIGTCTCLQNTDDAALFLRFDSFSHPVVFPTETYENEYGDRQFLLHLDDIDPIEERRLERLISSDPLTKLGLLDKKLLWKYRYHCIKKYEALPKILQSAQWNVLDDVIEVKKLLLAWSPMPPKAALELLDANFDDIEVRACAVKWLEVLSDNEVMALLLQLVQALKYEPYIDCALARFLLKRALNNRILGHQFFWYLSSEMEDPSVSVRFGLMLEAYLRGSGTFMEDLVKQSDVISKLVEVANVIKNVKSNQERKEALNIELSKISIPSEFQISLDVRMQAKALKVDKCKFMDSKKLPLWCVFENCDVTGNDIYIIFKSGDDLRQDMLTLQMIRIMDKLWRDDNLNLKMLPYNCISTGNGVGMIEVVLNAETVSNIQLSYGGSRAAFKDQPIDEWLRKQNPDPKDFEKAVETFTLSCAGYCVATYVLGIGDRHNDNIMVTKFGNLFHIDFGHFLGNIKTKFGFKRERAPFVLTPDFVYVMTTGLGTDAPQFKKFVTYCVRAYLILRRNSHMFINLFAMMLSTGIPELKSAEDISYLRDALCLGKSEEEAAQEFTGLIFESLKLGWSTQLNWWLHNLVHGK